MSALIGLAYLVVSAVLLAYLVVSAVLLVMVARSARAEARAREEQLREQGKVLARIHELLTDLGAGPPAPAANSPEPPAAPAARRPSSPEPPADEDGTETLVIERTWPSAMNGRGVL
jgi:hypothetical protein